MACGCGWKFFLPETTQGWRAPCPNCGGAVPIPGRKPGAKVFETAGQLAAEKERGWARARLAIGLGLVGAVGLVALAVWFALDGSAEAPRAPYEPRRTALLPAEAPPPPLPASPPSPSAHSSAPPGAPPGAPSPRQEARQATAMINLAVLVAETLRLRGMKQEDRDRMIALAGEWEAKLRAAVARAEESGEPARVEDYLRPSDAIVGFARKDFSTLTCAQSADLLAGWLATFRAGALEQVLVNRGAQRMVVYVDIPESSVELLGLARTPTGDFGQGGSGPAAPSMAPAPPATAAAAADLARQVEAAFARLPPGYRRLLHAADHARLDPVLQTRSGSPEDLEYVRNRILGYAIPAFEREVALLSSRTADLEGKLKAPTSVDVIHFRDGRKVEGQLLEETETALKFRGRLGTITVPRAEVLRVERDKGGGREFPDRLKAAAGRLETLRPLLAWCRERGLRTEGEHVSCLILALDAADEAARAFLQLRDPLAEPTARAPSVTVTAPSPSAPPPPRSPSAAVDMARSPLTVDRLDAEAADVVRRYGGLNDVIAQMRSRSTGHPYGVSPPVPVKSSRAATLIGNPLTYRPSLLSPEATQELAAWWSGLAVEDRKAFARFIGLWCSHLRTRAGN